MQMDYIICDSPAGIEKGALMAAYFADEAVVVTNPEVSSVRDSDRMIGILASKTRHAEQGDGDIPSRLLLTRYSPERVENGQMLSVKMCRKSSPSNCLGVIPESQAVLNASNARQPGDSGYDSDAGQAYSDAVARFLGDQLPHRFHH